MLIDPGTLEILVGKRW